MPYHHISSGRCDKRFQRIFSDIIIYNSFRFDLTTSKFYVNIGYKVTYWCTKFEGNQPIRRLFLVGSALFLKWCEVKENWRKSHNFLESISVINYWTNFLQIWYLRSCTYMEGIKHVNLVQMELKTAT